MVNRTVKKIHCKVVRSVPLIHKTSERNQPERANSQAALSKTVRGRNARAKAYEQSAHNTGHLGDTVTSDFGESFGRHKFAEEAAKGQFLDVWA